MKNLLCLLVVCGLLALTPNSSEASIVVNFTRLSDSTVGISGSGQIQISGIYLVYRDVSTDEGNGGTDDEMTGNFQIGAAAVDTPGYPFITFDTNDLDMVFSSNYSIGDSVNGSGQIVLDVETWVPVGSTGEIFNLATDTGAYTQVGTWNMNAVPEPTSFAMFGMALLGLAKRRRKNV